MDTDPIQHQLNEIEAELEAAIANLNTTNQRVDDLLAEYGSGEMPLRKVASPEATDAVIESHVDSDELPPEY